MVSTPCLLQQTTNNVTIVTHYHKNVTYTVQCWDQVVEEEDNAFHVHTACTLTMEVGTPGVAANVLLAGASHGLGEVHTYADGVVLDSMTLAWVNKSMVGVQEVDKTL